MRSEAGSISDHNVGIVASKLSAPAVLIIEPDAHGHRFRYVRFLAEEALRRNYHVTLATCPISASHPSYERLRQSCPDLRIVTFPDVPVTRKTSVGGLSVQQWRSWRAFSHAALTVAKANRVDFVLVPYLNYIDKASALFGSPFRKTPWGGILLRDHFFHPCPDGSYQARCVAWAKRQVLYRLLRQKSLRRVFALNPELPGSFSLPLAQKLEFLPDAADLSDLKPQVEARRALQLSPDRRYILVYGYLDSRKGVADLLTAARMIPQEIQLSILLVGQHAPEMREFLQTSATNEIATGRVVSIDRFVSEDIESLAFSAADLVWMGYKNHLGSSGVLGQAAKAGKPVIACDTGVVGRTASEFALGPVVNTTDPLAVSSAIVPLLTTPNLAEQYARNGLRFASERTPRRFAGTVLDQVAIAKN